MTTLTELETKVLLAFTVNYDDAETEKSDNATYATVNGIVKTTGLEMATVRGVIGSLTVKGLIWQPEQDNVSSLTSKGVDMFYSVKTPAVDVSSSDDWEALSEEESEKVLQTELALIRSKQARPVWKV